MLTASTSSSRNLNLQHRVVKQSDYGTDLHSEDSVGTSRRLGRTARNAQASVSRGLAESLQAHNLHVMQFPHNAHYLSALQPGYSNTIIQPYDTHTMYKIAKHDRSRARVLPWDRGEPSITETLLNPINTLNLGPQRPPRSLTRTQRYAADHSVRAHPGVGAKSGAITEARAKANQAKVYAYDPSEQRPERSQTITQRYIINAHVKKTHMSAKNGVNMEMHMPKER